MLACLLFFLLVNLASPNECSADDETCTDDDTNFLDQCRDYRYVAEAQINKSYLIELYHCPTSESLLFNVLVNRLEALTSEDSEDDIEYSGLFNLTRLRAADKLSNAPVDSHMSDTDLGSYLELFRFALIEFDFDLENGTNTNGPTIALRSSGQYDTITLDMQWWNTDTPRILRLQLIEQREARRIQENRAVRLDVPIYTMQRRKNQSNQNIRTPFLRTQAVHDWMKHELGFIDRGPPYGSVHCVDSFSKVTSLVTDMNAMRGVRQLRIELAVLKYLNKHSLHSVHGPKEKVELVTVNASNNAGVTVLDGEQGLVARVDMSTNTCLGQYTGDELFEDEFLQRYGWAHFRDHPYFSRKSLYHLSIPHDLYPREKRSVRRDYTIDSFFWPDDERSYNRDLDRGEFHDLVETNLLSFINDARKDLATPYLTDDDLARLNTDFVVCYVNRLAIFPFVVTTQPVQAGQQLFNFYGSDYLV